MGFVRHWDTPRSRAKYTDPEITIFGRTEIYGVLHCGARGLNFNRQPLEVIGNLATTDPEAQPIVTALSDDFRSIVLFADACKARQCQPELRLGGVQCDDQYSHVKWRTKPRPIFACLP